MLFKPRVPWVPSRDEVVRALLRLLRPSPGDVFVDIGCGDGRVVASIAREYGVYSICIEIKEELALRALKVVRESGVDRMVDVVVCDMYDFPLSKATMVYMYLLTSANDALRGKLERELKRGSIVVTLDFPVPGWRPLKVVELPQVWQRTLYVYVMGYSDDLRRRCDKGCVAKLVGGRLAPELLEGALGGCLKLVPGYRRW